MAIPPLHSYAIFSEKKSLFFSTLLGSHSAAPPCNIMSMEERRHFQHVPLTEGDKKSLDSLKDWLLIANFEEARWEGSACSLCTFEEISTKIKLLEQLDLARVD